MDNEAPQFHIGCKTGDVGHYVLMPGSPERVPRLAERLERYQKVSQQREYRIFTGFLDGVKVSVCSTGIGGPSTAIAIEELSRIGAHTFVRVGTSGIMQDSIKEGELIVATAAVRDEGTSHQYMPAAFPAVADPDIVQAFRQGCINLGYAPHVGVVHSKDSFYGEMEPHRMPMKKRLLERWEAWCAAGTLCSEMEAAPLFVIASILQKRAGALLVGGAGEGCEECLCEAAIEGLRCLIHDDKAMDEVR